MSQKKSFSLKTALLQSANTAIAHTLFGVPVHIRRLTVCELMDYDEALGKAQTESDQKAATLLGAQLILSALVDEQGKSVPASDLPSPAELLSAHDNAALFDAIRAIQSHSYGTLEEAEKN